MASGYNTAEAVPLDTVPTTGNTGATTVAVGTSSTIYCRSAAAAHLTRGYEFTLAGNGSDGATRIIWSGSGTAGARFLLSAYVRVTTTVTAVEDLLGIRNASAQMGTVVIGADGKLIMYNTSGTSITASKATNTFPINTWVRIEMVAKKGTGTTDGTLGFAYYLGSSSTAEYTWEASNVNAGTNDPSAVFIGRTTGRTEAHTIQYDTIRWTEQTSGFLNPYVTPDLTTNLIQAGVNGTFEGDVIGWSGTSTTQVLETTTVHSGSGSMKITWPTRSAQNTFSGDVIAANPVGRAFLCEVWVYVPTGSGAPGLYVLGESTVQASPSQRDQWVRLAQAINTDGGTITPALAISNTTAGWVCYVDDFKLIPLANIIINGNFGTFDDADITGITASGSTGSGVAANNTIVHSGNGSLQLTTGNSSLGSYGNFGSLTLTVGQVYTLSAWLYVPSASLAGNFGIGVGGNTVTTLVEPVTTADTWVYRSISFLAAGSSVTVRVPYTTGNTSGRIAYADDVTLIEHNSDATIQLSGVGTLALPTAIAGPTYSGSGTLGATGAPALATTASLSGSGTLGASGTPAWSDSASLAGAGSLTADGLKLPWLHHVTIAAPGNGTADHTVGPDGTGGSVVGGAAFSPTAGNVLLVVVEGSVTSTTPSGWTLPSGGSAVNYTGLYVWYRTAAGSDQLTTTHNGSNYPVVFDFYELAAGSSFLGAASATGVVYGEASPTLSGLTSDAKLIMTAAAMGVGVSFGNYSWTWGASAIEAADTYAVNAGGVLDGYSYGLAYLPDSTATSQAVGAYQSSSITTYERLVFAVQIAVAGPALTGTADFAGSGALGASGAPGQLGGCSLAGDGSLGATGAVTGYSGALGLSGSGSLVVYRPQVASGAAALSGYGTLRFAPSVRVSGQVTLSASGTLTAVVRLKVARTLALSGTGTLVQVKGVLGWYGRTTLAGVGALTLVVVGTGEPSPPTFALAAVFRAVQFDVVLRPSLANPDDVTLRPSISLTGGVR